MSRKRKAAESTDKSSKKQRQHHHSSKKKKHRKHRSTKHGGTLPADHNIAKRIPPPIHYAEAGINNAILPAAKVVSGTVSQWVNKLFAPLTTPDRAVKDVVVQQFQPTTLGLFYF